MVRAPLSGKRNAVTSLSARRMERVVHPETSLLTLPGGSRRESPRPYSGMQADRDQVSEILPGRLYVSNFRGAENVSRLLDLGITHVVCINDQAAPYPLIFKYLVIRSVEDHRDGRIDRSLGKIVRFVSRAFEHSGRVLMHCAAGISRSPAAAMAVLMALENYSLRSAFYALYDARPVIWPNHGFMTQLIHFERHVRNHKAAASGWRRRRDLPAESSLTITEYERWTGAGMDEAIKQLDVAVMESWQTIGGRPCARSSARSSSGRTSGDDADQTPPSPPRGPPPNLLESLGRAARHHFSAMYSTTRRRQWRLTVLEQKLHQERLSMTMVVDGRASRSARRT